MFEISICRSTSFATGGSTLTAPTPRGSTRSTRRSPPRGRLRQATRFVSSCNLYREGSTNLYLKLEYMLTIETIAGSIRRSTVTVRRAATAVRVCRLIKHQLIRISALKQLRKLIAGCLKWLRLSQQWSIKQCVQRIWCSGYRQLWISQQWSIKWGVQRIWCSIY